MLIEIGNIPLISIVCLVLTIQNLRKVEDFLFFVVLN